MTQYRRDCVQACDAHQGWTSKLQDEAVGSSPEAVLTGNASKLWQGVHSAGAGGANGGEEEEGQQALRFVVPHSCLQRRWIHSPLVCCCGRQQAAVADPGHHAGLLQRAVGLQKGRLQALPQLRIPVDLMIVSCCFNSSPSDGVMGLQKGAVNIHLHPELIVCLHAMSATLDPLRGSGVLCCQWFQTLSIGCHGRLQAAAVDQRHKAETYACPRN